MLFDAFDDLNWLAVIVAALAYFALGGLWYSDAMFGKQWREQTGVQMSEGGAPPAGLMITNLVLWFIAALALGLVAKSIGAETFGDGVVLGLVTSVGFVGTSQVVTRLFEQRMKPALARINAPYIILGFMIMGVILAMWD